MSPVVVELDLSSLPMTWERDAGPFRLALIRRGLTIREAPIGIWRLPHLDEHLTSAWPASFIGPLKPARQWELRTPAGETIAAGTERLPRLWGIDTMNVTLTLVGR